MLRRSLTAAALAVSPLLLAPAAARAQGGPISPACQASAISVQRVAEDACQKAVDLFQFLAPQLGALVAGGNAEPGQGGTVGGIGHFGLSLRANVLRSPLPEFNRVSFGVTGAQRSDIAVNGTTVAFPAADLAIGLFSGVSLGLTRVGGIDALVNATYLPDVTQDQVSVRTTGGALRFGYGARLGLLSESAVVPGVGLSVLRRQTPTVNVAAASGDDSLDVRNTRVRADSWRLTASKRLLIVAVAAGVGQDRYRSQALVRGVVTAGGIGAASSSVALTQRVTRNNVFANLTILAVPFARVVGEVGRVSGGSLDATYNSIDGRRPDAAYTYGSVGVRVGR